MAIKVTCACGKVTNVPDAYAGRTGKCPACKQPVKVPMLESVAMAAPADAPTMQSAQAAAPQLRAQPRAAAAQIPQHAPEPETRYEPSESHEPAYDTTGDEAPPADETPDYAAAEPAAPPALQQPLAYASPRPGGAVDLPTTIPQKLRQSDCPPLFLVISADGAEIRTKYNPGPVVQRLAETLAMGMKKKFDLRLDPPADDSAPIINMRVVKIVPGNRFLRYMFGPAALFLGGTTCFEVDGSIHIPGKEAVPFKLKRKAWFGLFIGGSSRGLLKRNAKVLGKKIAGRVKAAQK